MREIDVRLIKKAVADLCIEANLNLPDGMRGCLEKSAENEESPLCHEVLTDCVRNLDAAKELGIPICQDTGMAVVFIDIGQEVSLVGGDLYEAINSGVAEGYERGGLRMSVVSDPLNRINTKNNTPAVIHANITQGESIRLTVAPKGFGSENMSRIKMFNPSAAEDEIIEFITETVSLAGSNPCPPVVVGVGIGGDFEYAAFLSKKALCRRINRRNNSKFYAGMETKTLAKINALGIGAQGFGGSVTALGVNIEYFPTHIAGLPVAVNIGCHVTRHAGTII